MPTEPVNIAVTSLDLDDDENWDEVRDNFIRALGFDPDGMK